jgi:hypothetical protein
MKRQIAVSTIKKDGFFSSQRLFFQRDFLEILMLFYVKFLFILLRPWYSLHDFLGSEAASLRAPSLYFLRSAMHLCCCVRQRQIRRLRPGNIRGAE